MAKAAIPTWNNLQKRGWEGPNHCLCANARPGIRITFFWHIRSLSQYGESVRPYLKYTST